MKPITINTNKSAEMQRELSMLIARSNALCQIEEEFERNKIAKEYYNQIISEVGTAGTGTIIAAVLSQMAFDLQYYQEEETRENKRLPELNKLRSENRKFSSQLEAITKIISGGEIT